MFERRLRWFVILVALVTVPILARLIDIQLVHAEKYEQMSERLLPRSQKYLRAPRGSIIDRAGRVLVNDIPAADISVHYAVLAGTPAARSQYLRAQARKQRDAGSGQATTAMLAAELDEAITPTWKRLAELTGRDPNDFLQVADQVRRRVSRIKESVEQRTGGPQPIREETAFHPLLEGLDDAAAFEVRKEFEGRCPWLTVSPGSRRVAENADSVVHLLGRLSSASNQRIESDPFSDDELRRLRPGDVCGISGVERACDALLRGTRGVMTLEADGTVVERTDAVRGQDIYLTIDTAVQEQVLEILKHAVDEGENPAGGSAVVIDVSSREVLALASYPTYPFDSFSSEFRALRDDTRLTPLRFRAISNEYPPGSVCKTITLTGALSDGAITPQTRFECTGVFAADQAEHFRCWIYNQYGATHGSQTAEDAIRNSCNIFCYHTGERMGARRLCEWYRFMGLGESQGTGLIEEADGRVPTDDWLQDNFGRDFQTSDAWNYAIGQGEVTATPLQMANLAATLAAGYWEPVVIMKDEAGNVLRFSDQDPRRLDENAMRVIRTGMWRVVNEPGATAYHARLDRNDYHLCGKTGSAQTEPLVIDSEYTLEWPDGRRESMVARSEEGALANFSGEKPAIVGRRAHQRYPARQPGEKMPSHAWFMGFVQPAATPRGNAPRGRTFAICVMIEFGGGGGRVAGPVARDIAQALLEREP